MLPQAVIRQLRHIDDGLALGDQLRGGFELEDDLLRYVPVPFHSRVHGPDWQDGNSHSPWNTVAGVHVTTKVSL